MKPTAKLHDIGQSLWLDNITRTMLADGTLQGYIDELSVTGLTSNPTIFDKAISAGDAYDEQIAELSDSATTEDGIGATPSERIFFELALADLRDATDLFKPVHERTAGVDGFCSLEVSPLIADDAEATIEEAAALHAKAERDNLFIKIPGTEAGLTAIEESIFAGIPINVTCSSRTSNTWPRPKLSCAGSSGACMPGWIPTSVRWPRCSSAAGTRP